MPIAFSASVSGFSSSVFTPATNISAFTTAPGVLVCRKSAGNKGFHRRLAELLVAVADDVGVIDEQDLFLVRHRLDPGVHIARGTGEDAVGPAIVDRGGHKHGGRSLGPHLGHEFPQVPAERVLQACLARAGVEPLLGLFAKAGQRVVVVAELQEDDVARFQHREYPVPIARRDEGADARAADGAVHEVDLRRIEICRERVAPAELGVITITAPVANGGVSDQEEIGQRRVDRLRQVQPALEIVGSVAGRRLHDDVDGIGRCRRQRATSRGKGADQRLLAQALESRDKQGGLQNVPSSARAAGLDKFRPRLRRGHRLVAVSNQRGQVNEGNAVRLRNILELGHETGGIPIDATVRPPGSNGRTQQDRTGPLGFDGGNDLTAVPIRIRLTLLPRTCRRGIELEHHHIGGLQFGHHPIPVSAGQTNNRPAQQLQSLGVEVPGGRRSPGHIASNDQPEAAGTYCPATG